MMRVTIALLMSVFLSGCIVWVEDATDLNEFVRQARAKPSGRVEPLPEYKPYESFVYEGSSLREPFVALQPLQAIGQLADPAQGDAEQARAAIMPDEERKKEYLEQFPLDDLIMVGTIRHLSNNTLWALVRDTRNEIHRVNVGDHMGLDFGEVLAIDERKLELMEIISNGRGGWMKRPRVMALRERVSGEKN